MAVRADDLALRDLIEDALPAPIRQRLGDVEQFVAEVVELQNDCIGLAAVNTRMASEILDQVGRPL